ncbi:MAG: transcriptional repressor [Candidatus Poribacteria bacterium]
MHDALTSRLRDAGHCVTRQRVAIYGYLRSTDGHPSAEQVYDAVRGKIPRVSLATVHGGFYSLMSVGLVREIARGVSPARDDAGTEEHAHFRCSACDQIRDVPMPSIPPVPAESDVGGVVGVNVVRGCVSAGPTEDAKAARHGAVIHRGLIPNPSC